MTTPARGPVRRLRTAIAALLAAVGLLALAGCMKVDMDMTLSEDDTVSGTMIMAVSNSLAETMGMEPGELWKQAGGELSQNLPEGASQEPWSDDDYTGTKYTFTDAPIDQISGEGGEDLSITRDGDDYVVDGTLDLAQGADQLKSLPQKVQDAFDVRLAITFPGAVSDATGAIDGTTVTWTPQVGEKTEIHAVGSAEADNGFPWWIVGLVVGLVVIGLVVWFVVRNNRRPAPVTGTATGDAAFAAETTPGAVPAAGPTPEEQVFGGATTEPPTEPPTGPTTGPVAEPLEPEAAPEPAPPAGPSTGPVAEPLEPGRPGEEDAYRREHGAAERGTAPSSGEPRPDEPETDEPGSDDPGTDDPGTTPGPARPTDPTPGA
ncbi:MULTISPECIES: LppM family (lipo)protein [unclassified Isoptericola]|uniref:LppM family (lipo)protein n=1 Tax=unclassified Isoptericola TaxID=2623355 RepID=UPI003649DFE9